jgi:predicted nucleic acid-binding protein
MRIGSSRSAAPSIRHSTLSSESSIQRSLRRIKPDKHLRRLRPTSRSALTFVHQLERPFPKLLLDTTVYIDELQGKLPRDVEIALRLTEVWHSTVTEGELTALSGLLRPAHPGTRTAVGQVLASVDRRPPHRILNPDRDVWREAGILAGLLARLQSYGKSEQRRTLNDALIFLTAAKFGCSVLTRNLADFDFLMQLAPTGQAIFYETA